MKAILQQNLTLGSSLANDLNRGVPYSVFLVLLFPLSRDMLGNKHWLSFICVQGTTHFFSKVSRTKYMYTEASCGQGASAPVDSIKCLVVVPGGLGADVRESPAAHYTVKEVTLDFFKCKNSFCISSTGYSDLCSSHFTEWECTLQSDSGNLSQKPYSVFSHVSKDSAPS